MQKECLTYAMTPKKVAAFEFNTSLLRFEEYGIWGGSTPRERRRFFKQENGLERLQDHLLAQAHSRGFVRAKEEK